MTARRFLRWAWAWSNGAGCYAWGKIDGHSVYCRRMKFHPGEHQGLVGFREKTVTLEELQRGMSQAVRELIDNVQEGSPLMAAFKGPSEPGSLLTPDEQRCLEIRPRRSGDHDVAEAANSVLHARVGRQYQRPTPGQPGDLHDHEEAR